MSSFSDNFNRADGALGANWAAVSGRNAPVIFSNTVRGGATSGLEVAAVATSAATFAANQWAEVEYTAVSGADLAGPAVRVDTANATGYCFRSDSFTSGRTLARFSGGTVTVIGAANYPAIVGDIFRIEAEGTSIRLYKNGTLQETVTDATYSAGQPGIIYDWQNTRGTRIDNFSASNISAPSPATKLLVTTQPQNTAVNSTMANIVVSATDAGNVVDTSYTGDVVLTDTPADYTGTKTKAAVAGVATFDNIVPLKILTGTTMSFTSGALTGATSSTFNTTAPTGGATIPLEAEPMATPVLKNTATANKRRIYFNVWNDDSTPWSGSVTGVKVALNGTNSTNDIVRVAGALHYIEATQAESNTSEPVITAVLAASGSRIAAQGIGLVSETDFVTASPTSSAIADEVQTRTIAAVTTVNGLAANAITATAIASNAITDAKIASNAITAAKIATDAIGSAQLATSAVTEIQAGLATAAALTTTDGKVDGIKAKTDSLTFTVAGQVDANTRRIAGTTITGNGVSPKFGV